MNNSTEFTDESKPLDPQILNGVNADQASENSVVDHVKGSNDTQDKSGDFEAIDFTCNRGLQENAKYFERVQDVSNLVLNGFRTPFCSADFRPTTIPKSRQGVPVIPNEIYITRNGVIGNGGTFFASGWMNTEEENSFGDFIDDSTEFEIKMDERTKAKMMTLVSIWSNEYMDKGVHDSRARPEVVLGDWAWALTPTFSMTTRKIRTDLVATWMYGSYTPTTPAGTIKIINANDLKNFMNTTGGNYWPIPQNTPCLALGKTKTGVLPRLAVFGHPIFIDFDSSMNANRGTLTNVNDCPAYEVTCNLTVYDCDLNVARILNETFSGIDLQWAIFANTLPLASDVKSSICYGVAYHLRIYQNSICDQFINFYATHRDSGNKLPVTTAALHDFIQAWRIYKTAFTQRALIELGVIGLLTNNQTYGKALPVEQAMDLTLCCFEIEPSYLTNNSYNRRASSTPLWICYELWVANGAKLTFDDEDYVDGQSGVMTNCNYKVPRSQVVVNLTDWASTANFTGTTYRGEYYIPNNDTRISGYGFTTAEKINECCSCVPCTVPVISSTTETGTLLWNKAQTVDFSYTSLGKNDNTVFRKKMVFN